MRSRTLAAITGITGVKTWGVSYKREMCHQCWYFGLGLRKVKYFKSIDCFFTKLYYPHGLRFKSQQSKIVFKIQPYIRRLFQNFGILQKNLLRSWLWLVGTFVCLLRLDETFWDLLRPPETCWDLLRLLKTWFLSPIFEKIKIWNILEELKAI